MQADSPTPSSAARLGTTAYSPAEPGEVTAAPAQAQPARPAKSDTAFITGAYLPSGNHMIDRMLELERTLKRFNTLN